MCVCTCGSEVLDSVLVVHLLQAVQQEAQGAGAVHQHGQEEASGAACGAGHLQRAARHLLLTAQNQFRQTPFHPGQRRHWLCQGSFHDFNSIHEAAYKLECMEYLYVY